MTPAKRAAPAAKSVAGERVSGGSRGAKSVAAGRVSGSDRVVPVRKGRAPVAGDRFRREMSQETDGPGVSALIDLGATHANRLEQIAAVLAGDASAWLQVRISGEVADVRVSNLVTEERQRSAALQRIVMDIHRMRSDSGGPPKGSAPAGKSSNPLARIAKGRRA